FPTAKVARSKRHQDWDTPTADASSAAAHRPPFAAAGGQVTMSSNKRWYICAFVFFATVLNYMDRQTLSIVAPLAEREFRLDNAHLGLLFSAFYISYGISVAVIGELIDRISIRIAFAAVVTWWSLATSLTALSRTFSQLFAFRMLLGIGEAGNWPATARLVSMYLP